MVLVYCQSFPTRIEALEAERKIKGWTRVKKEALIAQDWPKIRKLAKKEFNNKKTVRPECFHGSGSVSKGERF